MGGAAAFLLLMSKMFASGRLHLSKLKAKKTPGAPVKDDGGDSKGNGDKDDGGDDKADGDADAGAAGAKKRRQGTKVGRKRAVNWN